MAESKVVQMKLLINTQTKQVLFAEANKDCVDFLFHILSLPIASVIRLLRGQGMVGSLPNLYESVENLNDSYIQPDQTKNSLLKPKLAMSTTSSVPLMLLDYTVPQKTIYRCSYCSIYSYSDDSSAICTSCKYQMNRSMPYVAPPKVQKAFYEGGFVKEMVTYMVMDDLVVKPMSAVSGLALLNKYEVKETGILIEKEVEIGMKEALKLPKASFHFKKVLTEVFLANNFELKKLTMML
ncbi:hypothetical protein ACJIZ3_017304 [Penstemon smallii]|uniref:Uncharacterized protein n=1 Tax=Penstemon smallii TaxID=265156 RepID=A0ABD3SWG2_9LAMI